MPPGPAFIIGMMAGALTLWILQAWRRRIAAKAALQASRTNDDNARVSQEVGDLRQRLAVLERITTDPAYRTAAEIEALR